MIYRLPASIGPFKERESDAIYNISNKQLSYRRKSGAFYFAFMANC